MKSKELILQRIKELERWESECPTNAGQGQLKALKWVIDNEDEDEDEDEDEILSIDGISEAIHQGKKIEDQYGNVCFQNMYGDIVKHNKDKTQIQINARINVGNKWKIIK